MGEQLEQVAALGCLGEDILIEEQQLIKEVTFKCCP